MRELREHEIDRVSGASFSLTLTSENVYQSRSVFRNGLLVEYSWSNLWLWTKTLTNAEGTTTSVNASFTAYDWEAPRLVS